MPTIVTDQHSHTYSNPHVFKPTHIQTYVMASVVAESKSFDNVHKNLHHHPSLDASGFFMKDESTPIANFDEEHEEM